MVWGQAAWVVAEIPRIAQAISGAVPLFYRLQAERFG